MLISAIEHYSYCPRQCGLIHLESIFDENLYTLKGRHVHERVDQPTARTERGSVILRALPVWSERYGLIGRADVVEVLRAPSPLRGGFVPLSGEGVGGGVLRPVEYKVGPKVHARHAALQAAAQALCLEEMFRAAVQEVAVYCVKSKERVTYQLDDLREETIALIEAIREMQRSGRLPEPANDKRCPRCSLIDACQPSAVSEAQTSALASLFRPAKLAELP